MCFAVIVGVVMHVVVAVGDNGGRYSLKMGRGALRADPSGGPSSSPGPTPCACSEFTGYHCVCSGRVATWVLRVVLLVVKFGSSVGVRGGCGECSGAVCCEWRGGAECY